MPVSRTRTSLDVGIQREEKKIGRPPLSTLQCRATFSLSQLATRQTQTSLSLSREISREREYEYAARRSLIPSLSYYSY